MTQINPYLSFNGTCREVINLYQQCPGGDLCVQTVADSPVADQMPPHMAQQVLHSSLAQEGTLLLIASDMLRGQLVAGSNIAISVNTGSEEEGSTAFKRLSEKGEVTDPYRMMFWGAMFGACTDQCGIKWIVNFDKMPTAALKGERVPCAE